MTQDTHATHRQAFPEKLARQVKSQFSGFAETDMTAFTFDRVKSDFYTAKADLTIYNSEDKIVLQGRDFGDRTFFWQP